MINVLPSGHCSLFNISFILPFDSPFFHFLSIRIFLHRSHFHSLFPPATVQETWTSDDCSTTSCSGKLTKRNKMLPVFAFSGKIQIQRERGNPESLMVQLLSRFLSVLLQDIRRLVTAWYQVCRSMPQRFVIRSL